jgi:hypothetical protein
VWEPCREEGSSSPLRRSAKAEAIRSGGVRLRVRRSFAPSESTDDDDEYAALAEKYGVTFDDDDTDD